MFDIKKYIEKQITKQGFNLESIEIEIPPKEDMGDFALPCFKFDIENLKTPNEKAKFIRDNIELDDGIISEIKVIGPYLNFFVNKEFLVNETLKSIQEKGNKFGSSNIGDEKDLLIEHTSINPNASPHIGRARNSIIGDFLARLYKFEGFNVERNYFINDIGKQISMLVVGVEEYGNIHNITFNDMLELYIKINDLSKTDEMVEKKVFEYLNKLENGDKDVWNKFKTITDVCIRGQQEIFKKLDIKWDKFKHESDYVFSSETKKILEKLKSKGKLREDENGRLYVDLDGYNIPTKSPVLVLTREDKTSLYPLRDIAYTIDKIEHNSDNNIIVLGEDQEVYMKQIQSVLDILGYSSPKLISYSFVLLNGDKMATREGKVVLLEDFIEKTKEKITQVFKEKGSRLDDKTISSLASSCIKYSILNVSRKKIVNFSMEEATNFQGNSAIYLLYNYARINSILNKANFDKSNLNAYKFREELEYSIINCLYKFPEIIDNAYNSSESVIITNYLYNVAQKFSKYYENISILKEENELIRESRLALLKATKTVLENGMKVLGIEPIKRL